MIEQLEQHERYRVRVRLRRGGAWVVKPEAEALDGLELVVTSARPSPSDEPQQQARGEHHPGRAVRLGCVGAGRRSCGSLLHMTMMP